MNLKQFKNIPQIEDVIEVGDIVFAFPGKLCFVSSILTNNDKEIYYCRTPDNKPYGEFYKGGLRLLWKSNIIENNIV